MPKSYAKPFIKWAGGKGQLLNKFENMYPQELLNNEIDLYIEPFVGGGAVLFDVLQKYVKKAVIIDINKDLINCYKCIKQNVEKLIQLLGELEKKFYSLKEECRKEYFLSVRKEYNSKIQSSELDYEKASKFIFLNRTCFNGLYRVNSKGEFNVPFGRYSNPVICNKENLINVSNLLQNVEIIHGDYSICDKYVTDKTFVYFDPPYRPIYENRSFVNYDKMGFNDDNQKDLSKLFIDLTNRGAKVMMSNSDPKNVNENDDFFDNLYKGFQIERINAKRMINCQADKRGNVTEIVVRNYK